MTDTGLKETLVRLLVIHPILLIVRLVELLIAAILGHDREAANFEITNKKQEFSKLADSTDPGSDYE
jgi:hypothetical protein